MPGKIQWIQHKGHEILFNNRSSLSTEDLSLNVKEAVTLIKSSGKRDILYLVDNSKNIIIPRLKDEIKQAGKDIDPYVKKTAVLGTNNSQKILLNVLARITRMAIKVFDEPEEAKDWLIKP